MKRHTKLLRLGFLPYSNTSRIVSDCIDRTFEAFGEQISRAFILELSQAHSLPKELVVLRYDLIERSVKSVFGYGTDVILKSLKQNLRESFPILDDDNIMNKGTLIARALNEIQQQEVYNFIQNLQEHEHVVFLYSNEDTKYRLLDSFFDKGIKGPKGVLVSGSYKPPSNVKFINYNQVLSSGNRKASMGRLSEWIKYVHTHYSDNQQHENRNDTGFTRIAGEEDSWFLTNGFKDEIRSLEKSLGPHLSNRMSILCIYHQRFLADEEANIREIILSHSHAILDNPLLVYRRTEQQHHQHRMSR